MHTPGVQAVQAAISQAELELSRLGDRLQFLVTPEGGLQIARRSRTGLPERPTRVVARIAGADPMLWQAERPEGDVTLGMPYIDAEPRCVLSRRRLPRGAPVDLYHRGRPLAADRAAQLAPRLAMVRGLLVALGALLTELESLIPRTGEQPAADAFERWEALWKEMAARLAEQEAS